MDLIKIGLFIKEKRKALGLTQEELAAKLNVSFKTISRWECGLGLPDVSTMIPLCDILNISLNELLNGDHIDKNDYMDKAEEKLLEMTRQNEESNKRLLISEVLILFVMMVIMVGSILVITLVDMLRIWKIVILVSSFVVYLPLITFCILLEQKVGFYKCPECGEIYMPTFKQVFFAFHFGRTRYMKCPKCHHYHYQHKVLKK